MGLFRKITEGTQALTHEYMIHRDLKPANVMVDSKGSVKIIDLGYCEIIMAKKVMKTFNVGSPSYMAPEAYNKTLYSQKSDAWALGMILYEMLHGSTLDQGMDIKRYFDQLKNDANFVGKRISSAISLQVREVIEKALKYLPEERATISALKYQADLFHVNLRQKNTNVTSQPTQPVPPAVKIKPAQSIHVKFQPHPHSLKRVDSQNKISSRGFVSFKEFVAPESKEKANHMIKMKPLTSLDGFDSESVKAHSSASKGVAMNEKLSQFLQKTVKTNSKEARPVSSRAIQSINSSSTRMISARQIHHFPPPPQKMVKQVTVHYS